MTSARDVNKALGIAQPERPITTSGARTFWQIASLLVLIVVVLAGIPYLLYSYALAAIFATGFGWRGSVDTNTLVVFTVLAWVPYFVVLAGCALAVYLSMRRSRRNRATPVPGSPGAQAMPPSG
jgi:hypothetical protein